MSAFTRSIIVLLALGACGCAPDISDAEFLRCWGGKVQNQSAIIRFRAVLYPRNGVISANESCPERRLKMEFYEDAIPEWFPAFDMADQNPFAPIGIEGVARVTIKSRDNERMIVTVDELISGRVISQNQTQQMVPSNL